MVDTTKSYMYFIVQVSYEFEYFGNSRKLEKEITFKVENYTKSTDTGEILKL